MRTDQAFVLLLILLLPLTGCIDTIGEVDAQDSGDSQLGLSNHVVVYLDEDQSQTMYVNGSIIQIVGASYTRYAQVPEYTYMATGGVMMTIDVDCPGFFTSRVQGTIGDFIPTVPGTSCEITFTNTDLSEDGDYAGPMIIVFEEMHATRL